MGSITHVTDEEGNLLNRYEYDAWGNLTLQDEQVSNRFKYTGEQFDAITQQYYLRARFYNPSLARFMQEDTYRGDGLNLYAYCANNPVRYVDPSGHWCEVKQNAYERLVKENGFDINNIDPDTKLRFMAEAANIVAGRNVGRGDTVIELPGLVLPEENQLSRPGADVPNDGRRGEGGSGTGEYGDVGGHHVHAKAAFKGELNYDSDKGFSISQQFMKDNNLNHSDMSSMQRKLFKELYESGRPNTLIEHTRIAREALKAGGADDKMIDSLISKSLENLSQQGVTQPTRIPWYTKS